jgi:hypothetical protein
VLPAAFLTVICFPVGVQVDDRDERWFEWKDGCNRACEKPARLQDVVFYSMR